MKVRALGLVVLALASVSEAATVVLKGGKELEVASYTQRGNYVLVRYADGRAESYPLAAVDLAATRAANQVPEAVPAPARPTGPHSPFAEAVAPAGEAAMRVSDEDVQHLAPKEEGEEGGEEGGAAAGGQVVLLGYDKRLVGEDQWAISATISNTGSQPVQNIVANIKFLDEKGALVGSGTASFPGKLEAGQQGMISAAVSAPADARQISFEFQWQTITAAPQPSSTAPPPGGATIPPTEAQPAEEPADWTVPPGSSPNAMPTNPLAVPPLTTAPIPPQAPRGGGGE